VVLRRSITWRICCRVAANNRKKVKHSVWNFWKCV